MNRFAALLDRLAYEPSRNNKLRLLADYFRTTDDPDRGFALAAMTGALKFAHAKPAIIRQLISERVDPVLFEMSYDYVGDLSETVALLWPADPTEQRNGSCRNLRICFTRILIAVTDQMQRPCLQPALSGPMDQCIFSSMRHPDFATTSLGDRLAKLIPIRMI